MADEWTFPLGSGQRLFELGNSKPLGSGVQGNSNRGKGDT